MSYIRCLSNPEKLYIIGDRRGRIEFCGENLYMPRHVFDGALKRWYKNGCQDTHYRGFEIKEARDFRWQLRYKGWDRHLTLWQVTLWYICTRNSFRWGAKKDKYE